MATEDVITLGIGSAPADLTPFILVGLNASAAATLVATTVSGEGLYSITLSGEGKNSTAVSGEGKNSTTLTGGGII